MGPEFVGGRRDYRMKTRRSLGEQYVVQVVGRIGDTEGQKELMREIESPRLNCLHTPRWRVQGMEFPYGLNQSDGKGYPVIPHRTTRFLFHA